jgi:hypothetical protein
MKPLHCVSTLKVPIHSIINSFLHNLHTGSSSNITDVIIYNNIFTKYFHSEIGDHFHINKEPNVIHTSCLKLKNNEASI